MNGNPPFHLDHLAQRLAEDLVRFRPVDVRRPGPARRLRTHEIDWDEVPPVQPSSAAPNPAPAPFPFRSTDAVAE